MNNSGVVSGSQSTRHIHREIAGFAQTDGATAKAITQGFALQQLGNDVRRSVVLAHVEDRNNIGMVESGSGLRLQFKATETIRVPRPGVADNLDSHVSFQPSIACAIHFAHSTGA